VAPGQPLEGAADLAGDADHPSPYHGWAADLAPASPSARAPASAAPLAEHGVTSGNSRRGPAACSLPGRYPAWLTVIARAWSTSRRIWSASSAAEPNRSMPRSRAAKSIPACTP